MNRQHRTSRLMHTALAVAMMGCFVEAAGTATSDNPTGASAPRQPVKYLVKEKSLIGNELFEAGQTAEYDGLPAGNLEPLCDIGRARAAEYEASNKSRVQKMIENNQESGVGDPSQFAAQFGKALAQANQEHAERMAELQAQLIDMQEKSAANMNAAVASAVAETIKALFPAGLPTAAAPAAPAAPADDTASAEPTKRTKSA